MKDDVKPKNIIRRENPTDMNWVDTKTQHTFVLAQGMPMGLLLAITYPVTTTIIV